VVVQVSALRLGRLPEAAREQRLEQPLAARQALAQF